MGSKAKGEGVMGAYVARVEAELPKPVSRETLDARLPDLISGRLTDAAVAREIKLKALARTAELLQEGNTRWADGTASIAKKMHDIEMAGTDQAMTMAGLPTKIVEQRDFSQIVRTLVEEGIVDVVDAEVVGP